jgi:hypothetical protein
MIVVMITMVVTIIDREVVIVDRKVVVIIIKIIFHSKMAIVNNNVETTMKRETPDINGDHLHRRPQRQSEKNRGGIRINKNYPN